MANDMESMRTFADQLWKYMVPKLDSKFASNVSYFRAVVKTNLGNNMLEVERPLETGTLTLPCVRSMSGAQAGQQVVALVMGSMSNAIVVGDGKLNVPGGGGGDIGISNFQAQPDGSLVITLTDGETFTATPVMDDVPTQGSSLAVKSGGIYTALAGKADNAFANVVVGSTTIAADNKADTLTLVADGLVNLTGNATNDSVTISVDPNHTHITTQVLDLVNADSYGPSDLVTFDADVAEVPLKNCIVNIEPVQAGSGTPSPTNVRAISGWTGAQIHISPTTSASAGRTVSVDWTKEAGTVYGGTLDILTGVLTVDRICKTFTGTDIQARGSTTTSAGDYRFYSTMGASEGVLLPPNAQTAADVLCSIAAAIPHGNSNLYGVSVNRADGRIYLHIQECGQMTLSQFREWVDSHNVQVAYKLATPTTYQLSPQIISTLLGTNNIWADCGTVSVDYGAFLSALDKAIEEHSGDDIRHITEAERTAWNGKADWPHTHDASDIVSGILPAARGGTGNGNGYIQIGQKAGTTLGTKATAEGSDTTASGDYSHAEGNGTASGNCSHAEGSGTASNLRSHAEGTNTTASGNSSHAEGFGAKASGQASHAEGEGSEAREFCCHAEGYYTVASGGSGAHSEGSNTTASGGYSHAEGANTVASANGSHAEGIGTIAAASAQHVFGQYNESNTTSVEIVGWGTGDSNRKNIRTLSRSGSEWIAGTLTQASDARLKDVQGEIPDLSSVRAVRFRWKNGDDKEHLGYLAQDVEGIAPYLVGVDSNGYKSLDYIALLTAKVEMLEREIEELKGTVS